MFLQAFNSYFFVSPLQRSLALMKPRPGLPTSTALTQNKDGVKMDETSSIKTSATAEVITATSTKTSSSSATSAAITAVTTATSIAATTATAVAAASQPVLSDGSDSGSGGKASKGLKLEIKQKPNAAAATSQVTTPPYDIAGRE